MFRMPLDYNERCYAGWVAKLIGIRYGAPIEGWTYHQIKDVYGELDGYLVDYNLFAADDDSNGPMIFIRALNDATHTRDITANDIAQTWLNYAPYEHGFYWWGGYGRSTEHTAYLNLRAGIPAPRSGSIQQNGAAIAEQIGGQIFIDTWGLVLPDRPELAAEYAGKAASVSHDGNGVYGGQFVAAAISAAFTSKTIDDILERALATIPADCEYTRVVRDMMRFHSEHPDSWRDCYDYVFANWGYDRYPGNCHIIPNAAVMILSMLYGEGDFDRALNICNMCGWDTDCNVGNVATIMGVFVGLEGINYKKWRAPVNDFFAVSCVLGFLNSMDAPWCVSYLSDLAYRMAGEPMPERWAKYLKPDEQYFHFQFPGSTHGFRVSMEEGRDETMCENSGEGSLKAVATYLPEGVGMRISKRTYYYPGDFHDNRYDPDCSPILYPGQTISARVKKDACCKSELYASLYVRERYSGKIIESEKVPVEHEFTKLSFDIPSGDHLLIDEMGVRITSGCRRTGAAVVYVTDVRFGGCAKYDIDFKHEKMEYFTILHKEVSQFTFLKGNWIIENGMLSGSTNDYGEAYTGDIRWKNYSLEGGIMLRSEGEAGLNVRVQGAIRSYSVAIDGEKLMIRKNANGYTTLAECPFPVQLEQLVRLKIDVDGAKISVFQGDTLLLSTEDTDKPYLSGCIGCSLRGGPHAFFDHLKIDVRG